MEKSFTETQASATSSPCLLTSQKNTGELISPMMDWENSTPFFLTMSTKLSLPLLLVGRKNHWCLFFLNILLANFRLLECCKNKTRFYVLILSHIKANNPCITYHMAENTTLLIIPLKNDCMKS